MRYRSLTGLGLVPTLAALAVIALTVSAGNWQVRRAHQKEALQQRFDALRVQPPLRLGARKLDADAMDLRRVAVRGQWIPDKMVLLDNRVMHGFAGYHVYMPLRIENAQVCVLVNRGWIGAAPDRSILPLVVTPAGTVTVEGLGRAAKGGAFQLAEDRSAGKVWQTISVERYAQWANLDLQPIVIEQSNGADDGLTRAWELPFFGIEKHRGYAFQWYALAVLTVVLYIGFSLRRARRFND
jgi:surfeit locus 1 family protein